MDINKILLTGVAETAPVLTTLPQTRTPLCYFTLRVEERFTSNKAVPSIRPNYFRVESLGRQAEATYHKIKQGERYLIDGYLRQEHSQPNKIDIVKIRSFGVLPDPSSDTLGYRSGLEKALAILDASSDLADAITTIKELLTSEE